MANFGDVYSESAIEKSIAYLTNLHMQEQATHARELLSVHCEMLDTVGMHNLQHCLVQVNVFSITPMIEKVLKVHQHQSQS